MIDEKNLVMKHNEKVNSKYGINPIDRSIDELLNSGFVNLDKDSGPTSHVATDNLKKVLDIKKAGHSGTLDPKVTGVLLIGLGKATRLMEYMLKSNKEYVCHMFVHSEVSKEKILEVFKNFTGVIKQIPPVISAVKRQEREREIYFLKLLDYENKGKDILFRVSCQHGTYIRKLCTDMCDSIGLKGQMKELRRTKAGPIREENNIISLDNLRNLYELYLEEVMENKKRKKEIKIFEKELRKYIRPMEELLVDFKKVIIRDSAVNSVCHGSDLAIPGVAKLDKRIKMGEEIALLTQKGELVAIGTAYLNSNEVIKKNKGAFVKINKVFMETDKYPKVWNFSKEQKC